MRLEWLAAVLRPEDIALHPNFSSLEDVPKPYEALAAAVLGDPNRARWVAKFVNDSDESTDPATVAVLAAIQTLDFATINSATRQLAKILESSRFDIAAMTALGLVAMAAAGEVEDITLCENISESILSLFPRKGDAGHQLLRAAIMQQLSLRRRDFNRDWVSSCAFVADYCQSTIESPNNFDRFPDFDLSLGRNGSSSETIRHIIIGLRQSAWTLAPSFDFNDKESALAKRFPAATERLRYERSEQFLLAERRSAVQYSRYIEDVFNETFDSRTITWGRAAPELFPSTLTYELYGSGQVYAARKNLAVFRLTLSQSDYMNASQSDCLRLLRYTNSKKELQLAIAKIREGGPLAELSQDARSVLTNRLDPGLIRNGELQVLRGAADLLTQKESSDALDAVLALIKAGAQNNIDGYYESYKTRIEEPLRAAASLSNTADRRNHFTATAIHLLSTLEYDEILDRGIARALRGLNWATMDKTTLDYWLSWSRTPNLKWTKTVELVRVLLGLRAYPADIEIRDLGSVADALNDHLRGHELDLDSLSIAPRIVEERLRQIQNDAHSGIFSGGGIDAAELACILISMGFSGLWTTLTDLLLDPLVSRDDKTAAFERLSEENVVVPNELIHRFADSVSLILNRTSSSMMTNDFIVPYPAALAFFSKHQILAEPQVISGLNELASRPDSRSKAAAADCIATLAAVSQQDWVTPLTLQLSYDANSSVAAPASRALVHLLQRQDGAFRQEVAKRLEHLLRSDGVLTPLSVLLELEKSSKPIPPEIANSVFSLASNHPSAMVRVNAELLVGGR